MSILKNIFGTERGIVIGALHFPPLLGYPRFPGIEVARKNALRDLRAFESGKVHGIIFENNYDVPHVVNVGQETALAMAVLGNELAGATCLPLGTSTLWNDFRTSLVLAKLLGLSFVRIPVFVDKVAAACGVITGVPKDVVAYRRTLGAQGVALFTDIHVKHAKLLSRMSLVESARMAVAQGSDVLIVTGHWTGNAPEISELQSVRKKIGRFPIIVGSGANSSNISALLRYANGVIVSTSLKRGAPKKNEVNVKGYAQRIDAAKVRRLVQAAHR